MKNTDLKLVISAILHDIGKLVYRSGVNGNHSGNGYDYLKNTIGINDKDVLEAVRYHYAEDLSKSAIGASSIAYIVYIANKIAAAADRRSANALENSVSRDKPLASVFNHLNENKGNCFFKGAFLGDDKDAVYPESAPSKLDTGFYKKCLERMSVCLKELKWNVAWVNSLLTTTEKLTTFIPSSTSNPDVADISYFDHVKITAAVASCIKAYLPEGTDFKEALLDHESDFIKEKAFLLYSLDIARIQKFIYNIVSSGALKSLRARSFYIELVMEHVIDELLDRLSLSRANLLYIGGGHCYMLLPNTEALKKELKVFETEINDWFIEHFNNGLFIAGGYAECSAENLENNPKGSFAGLYQKVHDEIYERKMHPYSAEQILRLNKHVPQGDRECVICHRVGKLNDENRCKICASLIEISRKILDCDLLVVMRESANYKEYGEYHPLPLPFGKVLLGVDNATANKCMQDVENYCRSYTKNINSDDEFNHHHIFVGDYSYSTLDTYASSAIGIKRMGIMRADVDNLGATFAFGFRENKVDKYSTLSRSATLSRMLSLFFKYYINKILKNGQSDVLTFVPERKVSIVYSGGDDVFLAGSWNDVIDAFIDLRTEFRRFTQNTLSLSGGVGIYPDKFPINVMAVETEELVENSKTLKEKDGITLFENLGGFKWDKFMAAVIGEKFKTVQNFFDSQAFMKDGSYGKAFLYHLLDLIRSTSEKPEGRINRARLVYLLSRMEPGRDAEPDMKELYRNFSQKVYAWYPNDEDRRQLITAIYLYVYLTRDMFSGSERNSENAGA